MCNVLLRIRPGSKKRQEIPPSGNRKRNTLICSKLQISTWRPHGQGEHNGERYFWCANRSSRDIISESSVMAGKALFHSRYQVPGRDFRFPNSYPQSKIYQVHHKFWVHSSLNTMSTSTLDAMKWSIDIGKGKTSVPLVLLCEPYKLQGCLL